MGCNLAVHGPHCVTTEGCTLMRQAPQQAAIMGPAHSCRGSQAEISHHHKDLKPMASTADKASVHWPKIQSQDAVTQCLHGGDGIRLNSGGNKPRAHASRLNLRVYFMDMAEEQQKDETILESDHLASTSSSIGQASEDSFCAVCSGKPTEEIEVQSRLRSPLDQMSSLEDSLPAKRGLSKFFSGKSRSFSALSDVSSIRDLEKAENPSAKKRKWLTRQGKIHGSHTGCPPFTTPVDDISKKPLPNGRIRVSFAVENYAPGKKICGETSRVFLGVTHNIFSPRSFSLTDLNSAT